MPREHREHETRGTERGDRRDTPPGGVAAQVLHRGPQQREGEVVRHLHGQRPRVRQPGDEEVRRVDLREGQVCDPGIRAVDVVLLEQQHRGGDQHRVRRQDPHETRAEVLAGRPGGSRLVPARVGGVGSPQQEPGFGEEDGDRQVESPEQPFDG